MKDKTNHLVWDYLLIFLFIVSSGAVFWHGFSPAIAFSVFFVFSLANVFFVKRNFGKGGNNSFLFIPLIIILCIINYLVYSIELKDNSTFGYIVSLSGAYFVISRYDFYYFRKILTNIVYYITLFGLIVFLLSELNVLPVYVVTLAGSDYTMFLFYTLGWPDMFHRFSAIWHEPGACQIVLNTVLWLHFDKFCSWNWDSKQLKKCIVILIGSIATLSTGSYLVLMLMLISVLLKVKIKGKHKVIIYTLLVIAAPIIIYVVFNSPVIQNKIFDAEGEHISKINRLSDINALWRMTLERPVLGYGLGSVEFWKISDAYGNTACSTGILTYSASLGISWLVLFLVFLWRSIKKMNIGNAAIFLFSAIVLMQFNEKFIEYPITSIFIFSFNTYKLIKVPCLQRN